MDRVDSGRTAQFAVTARRNNSLSSSGRLFVFALMVLASLGIAVVFGLIFGAWPILPFAGLEVLGLHVAFRYIDRHAGDYERLAISGDRLQVEVMDGGKVSRFDCNRYWAGLVRDARGRLALRSHGREFEIGRHLNEQQRLSVARRLERELRAAR
jgi:uncharacterized membrane protein